MVVSTMHSHSSLCISSIPMGHCAAPTINVINPRMSIIKKMGLICTQRQNIMEDKQRKGVHPLYITAERVAKRLELLAVMVHTAQVATSSQGLHIETNSHT